MEGPFKPLFTTGNTGTDKVKTFGRQLTVTTYSVLEEGVTAINDDVAFIEVRLQESMALSVPAPAFTINRIRRGVSRIQQTLALYSKEPASCLDFRQ